MSDQLQRFIFEDLDIKGAIVRLDKSTHHIMEQHAYPAPVCLILSQVITASTLLMSTLKLNGQITIQCQNNGSVQLLVAKCNADFDIRGMCRWDNEALPQHFLKDFEQGELIVTLEDFNTEHRYQSIIPLASGSVEQAIEFYFAQSDQLATVVKLLSIDNKAYGFLLQQLPVQKTQDPNTWQELSAFVSTLTNNDFTDSGNNQDLLQKLFTEYSLRLFDPTPIQFKCTCSYDKMADTIRTIGKEEANAILSTHKTIHISCDYCNSNYDFSRKDVDNLFLLN